MVCRVSICLFFQGRSFVLTSSDKLSPTKTLEDETITSLIAAPLRAPKKKKAKAAANGEAKEEVKA